jgi:hypothetical protein
LIAELGHLLAFLALGTAAAQSVFGLTTGGETVRRLAVATAMFTQRAMQKQRISVVRRELYV